MELLSLLQENESISVVQNKLFPHNGLQDILITAMDNLNGFNSLPIFVLPNPKTLTCVVQQIRNACKHIIWKDGFFFYNIKHTYIIPTKQAGESTLRDFAGKCESKYSYPPASCE